MSTDPRLLEYARRMRREPTPCEEILWREFRNRKLVGFKFRRQHPLGHYIADFYTAQSALIVELDGDTHATPEAEAYDEVRYRFFTSLGVEAIRFWNAEVHDDLEGVLDSILRKSCRRSGSRRRRAQAPSPGVEVAVRDFDSDLSPAKPGAR